MKPRLSGHLYSEACRGNIPLYSENLPLFRCSYYTRQREMLTNQPTNVMQGKFKNTGVP